MELSFATKLLLAAILTTVLISLVLIVLVPKSSQQPVQKGLILDFICKNNVDTAVNNVKNKCNIEKNTIIGACDREKDILRASYITSQENLQNCNTSLGRCNTTLGECTTAKNNLQTSYDTSQINLNTCNTARASQSIFTTTFAGSVTSGLADGTGTNAGFATPRGVAIDSSGNLFVVDTSNHKIRKITPAGVVSTVAGSTTGYAGFVDGTGISARFNTPEGLAVDSSGNVFVADTGNNRIRKITPTGVVSTVAGTTRGATDGPGNVAKFYSPRGVAIDSSGNLFVVDTGNHTIRKITPTGEVSTFAGFTQGNRDGTGMSAQFSSPYGIAIDSSGNVFVADTGNSRIRKITPAGVVSTFAGSTQGDANGTVTSAKFGQPYGIAIDSSGDVFVADGYYQKIRKITAGMVSTVAGSTQGDADGICTHAKFNYPVGVAVDSSGNVFVADMFNHKIRKISKIISC